MSNVKNQGEGDRESARRYNENTQKFVKTDKGRASAKKNDHSGRNSPEALKKAEKDAVARAKENDPESLRDYTKPAK
jgi:hypothetical protein